MKGNNGIMEIGDDVIVKETGEQGKIIILEGIPYRRAYVEITPGASGGYTYIRMSSSSGNIETLALNRYEINELKKEK